MSCISSAKSFFIRQVSLPLATVIPLYGFIDIFATDCRYKNILNNISKHSFPGTHDTAIKKAHAAINRRIAAKVINSSISSTLGVVAAVTAFTAKAQGVAFLTALKGTILPALGLSNPITALIVLGSLVIVALLIAICSGCANRAQKNPEHSEVHSYRSIPENEQDDWAYKQLDPDVQECLEKAGAARRLSDSDSDNFRRHSDSY